MGTGPGGRAPREGSERRLLGGTDFLGIGEVRITAAGGLGDRRGDEGEVRPDRLDAHLQSGPLLASLVLPGLGHQLADDHDPVTLGQGLGDMLGELPPHGAAEEARVLIDPLAPLVAVAGMDRPTQGSDGLAAEVKRRSGSAVRFPLAV